MIHYKTINFYNDNYKNINDSFYVIIKSDDSTLIDYYSQKKVKFNIPSIFKFDTVYFKHISDYKYYNDIILKNINGFRLNIFDFDLDYIIKHNIIKNAVDKYGKKYVNKILYDYIYLGMPTELLEIIKGLPYNINRYVNEYGVDIYYNYKNNDYNFSIYHFKNDKLIDYSD
jgi:hypothetical protein